MVDEIDLRKYLRAIFSAWPWLVGLTLVAAVGAYIYILYQPKTYSASALAVVTAPQHVASFDPRYTTTYDPDPAYKSFLPLATSNDLIRQVYDLRASGLQKMRFDVFKNAFAAENFNDQSIIKLTVTLNDPEEAARLANLWAEAYVDYANAVLGGQGQAAVSGFDAQLQTASLEVDSAAKLLVAFEGSNDGALLDLKLADARARYEAAQAAGRELAALQQSLAAFTVQLAARPGAVVTPAELAAALDLQLRAVRLGAASFEGQAPTYTFGPESLTVTTDVQASALQALIAALAERGQALADESAAAAADAAESQLALSTYQVERERLQLNHAAAAEAYTVMASKLAEARLSAQAEGPVRLFSQAVPPASPASQSRSVKIASAAAVVFLLAALVIVARTWWRDDTRPAR